MVILILTCFVIYKEVGKIYIDSNQLDETNNSISTEGENQYVRFDSNLNGESNYIVTSVGDTTVIFSADLDKESVLVDKSKDSTLSQIQKGIQNFYRGTLINTVYDGNGILITNYDYSTLLPKDDLKLSSSKHELLFKYTYEPEVNVNDENGKLNIECFGNLKKCYVMNNIIGLVFESASMAQPEGPFLEAGCHERWYFVNIFEKQLVESVDRTIWDIIYNDYDTDKWRNISDFDEYLIYTGYKESIREFDSFYIIDISPFTPSKYGRTLWLLE